jgi:DNA-binding NtrC family response regulator
VRRSALASGLPHTDANVLVTGESGVGKDAIDFFTFTRSRNGQASRL